jgi:hypothetical protein
MAVRLNLLCRSEQRRLVFTIQNHVREGSASLCGLNHIILWFSQTCGQVRELFWIRFSHVTLILLFIRSILTAILLWSSILCVFITKFSLFLAEFQALD